MEGGFPAGAQRILHHWLPQIKSITWHAGHAAAQWCHACLTCVGHAGTGHAARTNTSMDPADRARLCVYTGWALNR